MADFPKPKLVIKKNPLPTDMDPGRYHIYFQRPMGNLPVRQRILGFSYFGEVGGLRRLPTDPVKYVTLDAGNPLADDDWRLAISDKSERPVVRMSFRQWFRLLAENNINFSRVFVYPDVEPAHYLFKRVNNSLDNTKYDLTIRGSEYLDLLRLYITYAQARNIIVQITIAGIHTLRPDEWVFHPMNSKRNINGWLATADGRDKFAVMRIPVGAADTEPEKNYVTQSRSLDWILEASSWAWNVVYELFNEPGGASPHHPLVGEVNWLVTTAKWLDERLRDPVNDARTHLITLNAGSELRNPIPDAKNIFKPLLFDGARRRTRPLIDVYSFHGDQWGGDPGLPLVRPNAPLTRDEIMADTRAQVNSFYDQPIDQAGNTIMGSPVALICDSDAQYRAQDSPKLYARAVRDLNLDYNHRWSETWLTQKKLCDQAEDVGLAAV